MILPFSTRRSRTSLISNCLYWASLTPRTMFSKSMNIASFRSSLIRSVLPGGRIESAPSPPIIGAGEGAHQSSGRRSARGGAGRRAHVVGAGSDKAVVRILLERMGAPAGHPRRREDRGAEVGRDAE